MNRNQQAAVYYIGLRFGLVSPSDVIEWADAIIQEDDSPRIEYIDLSVTPPKDKGSLLTVLTVLKEPFDFFESLKLFTPTLLKAIEERRISAREAGRLTYEYTRTRIDDIPSGCWEFYSFDDDFDLAESGIHGDLDDVSNQFIEFLKETIAEQFSGHNSGGCAPSA